MRELDLPTQPRCDSIWARGATQNRSCCHSRSFCGGGTDGVSPSLNNICAFVPCASGIQYTSRMNPYLFTANIYLYKCYGLIHQMLSDCDWDTSISNFTALEMYTPVRERYTIIQYRQHGTDGSILMAKYLESKCADTTTGRIACKRSIGSWHACNGCSSSATSLH